MHVLCQKTNGLEMDLSFHQVSCNDCYGLADVGSYQQDLKLVLSIHDHTPGPVASLSQWVTFEFGGHYEKCPFGLAPS